MKNLPGSRSDVKLTASERNLNAVRALAKLVPAAGEAIDQLVFGPIEELRQKRVQATLQEILQRLNAQNQEPLRTEEFATLIERALPKLARATDETLRGTFRDLLTNAAALPPNDERWAQANLAERLLGELEGPALRIMATISRHPGPPPLAIVARPAPQVIAEKDNRYDHTPMGEFGIGYRWAVVEEWMHRLREKRLLDFQVLEGRGGYGSVRLTNLGNLLVDWTISAT